MRTGRVAVAYVLPELVDNGRAITEFFIILLHPCIDADIAIAERDGSLAEPGFIVCFA